MFTDYPALTPVQLQPRTGYAQPSVPQRVNLEDQALAVMTDFKFVTAAVILPGDSIGEAHARMIQRGVRLLLVIDQDRFVLGLITAEDILGEKPMQVVAQRGVSHDEVTVRDIMTPQNELEVLNIEDVRCARVGHIVSTLKNSGRHHVLVVEVAVAERQTVRGLFSLTQIARQLGVAIPTTEVARTFSEIEAHLAH